MERFIQTQAKTNEALSESVSQLNSKFESLSTHPKMMETQLAQISQQVSHLSRPQGHLPGQSEANPKGHMNPIIIRGGKQLDEPKTIQGEEGECVAEEKSQPLLEDEVVKVSEDKEQGVHEEDPRPRVVESYRLPVPFP